MPKPELAGGTPGWMPLGACRGEDPELFFPVTLAGPALMQVFAAKAVCFRCAVRAACLSYALATGQAGIWGGTTQEERRAMRRPASFPAREHTASPDIPSAVPPQPSRRTLSPCTTTDGVQAGSTPITVITGTAATVMTVSGAHTYDFRSR